MSLGPIIDPLFDAWATDGINASTTIGNQTIRISGDHIANEITVDVEGSPTGADLSSVIMFLDANEYSIVDVRFVNAVSLVAAHAFVVTARHLE